MIVEAMLAYADKLIASLRHDSLAVYRDQLDAFFEELIRLDELDETVMMYMVQGHHPMKKMALHLVKIGRGNEDASFSCAPLARLM
jgi:pyruvate,orthophosphate dikinase